MSVRLAWQDVWRGGVSMLKVFGGVFAFFVVLGLYSPWSLTNWDWALAIMGCAVIVGLWRSWKGSSLLGAVLGAVLALDLILAMVVAMPAPIVALTPTQLMFGFVYASIPCAIAVGLGFLLGRLLPKRRPQAHQ
jgi:hypothetical protein